MFPKTPSHPGKSVRVLAVQFVFIVGVKNFSKSLFRHLAPFDDLLPPIHSHISMHLTFDDHLLLSRIPVWIMGLSGFQLFEAETPF